MFRRFFQKPVILFSAFILFTLLVSVFDRQPIGAEETKVGFAALNGALRIDYLPFFAVLSAICGVLAILICVFFAGIGLYQLISGKSIKKVDNRIILLGA
ncbi:MAG: phosphoesterase PA-phosphatase, partial [Clostridia bacterium]|nr:phosphoesterase PA-phosphatase [Clostridia bacterium]